MAFSYTGLGYLVAFLALGLLTLRFFQYWRKDRTTVAKLIFLFAGIFNLFLLVAAIGGLFFAQNSIALRQVVIISSFLQAFALATVGYLISYLKFPKISPWFFFGIILILGLIAFAIDVFSPFLPTLEENRAIHWNAPAFPDTLRFFLFLITLFPLSIIFLQQFRISKTPDIKLRAFGLSLILLGGLITGFLDFIGERFFKIGAISSDIALLIFSLIIIGLVFSTPKPEPQKYVRRI